jgi:Zn-finger nucleic acid-binding protein
MASVRWNRVRQLRVARARSRKLSSMNCPVCHIPLRPIHYEGVDLENCDRCGGEWLDAGELGKINKIREMRFSPEERRAVVAAASITPVILRDVDRDLHCPKCGGTSDPLNYGGDSGIIIDRCVSCHGLWLDGDELEKIQMLVEGWDDALPDDLDRYSAMLHDVAVQADRHDDAAPSRIPFAKGLINALVNRVLDLID